MTEPIIFIEERAGYRKRIELHQDRVVVKIRTTIGSRSDETFPLTNLQPFPAKARLPQNRFHAIYGLVILVCIPIVGFIAFLASGRISENTVGVFEGSIMAIYATIGLVFLVRGLLKLEHVIFRTQAGVAAFSFIRDNNKPDEFDLMTQKIVERIEVVQSKTS